MVERPFVSKDVENESLLKYEERGAGLADDTLIGRGVIFTAEVDDSFRG